MDDWRHNIDKPIRQKGCDSQKQQVVEQMFSLTVHLV